MILNLKFHNINKTHQKRFFHIEHKVYLIVLTRVEEQTDGEIDRQPAARSRGL